MFIFLLYILLNMKFTFSTIVVQDSGLYEIKKDDIGMVLYLTVENTFDGQIPISVYNIECLEGDPYSETSTYMYLLGGDMGYIERKRTKNLTLIYPNLYLRNRIGKCLVSLQFRIDQAIEEVRKEIYFDTNKAFVCNKDNLDSDSTCDTSNSPDCVAVDCVVKYSSRRSYYNKESRTCQPVPECPPNAVYLPQSNICRKLHEPVCVSDLEMIEDGLIENQHSVTNFISYRCHHGTINNKTHECTCEDGWTTFTCLEGAYHPTLNLYHMCNIELNSWERANREKLIMTILVLMILAIAIAAKMLLAVCLLNWCCHFIRSKSKGDSDEEVCDTFNCPYNYCGDEVCPGNSNMQAKSSRSIRVSFSNIDATSSAGETDVTVSYEDSEATENPSRANMCHCK